jgi:hypothetical protein
MRNRNKFKLFKILILWIIYFKLFKDPTDIYQDLIKKVVIVNLIRLILIYNFQNKKKFKTIKIEINFNLINN